MPGRNIWGLTNRQLMVRALRRVVQDAEASDFYPSVPGHVISFETLDEIRAILTEVVRNKRPTTAIKESKRI
jgi:hypothetical protein